MAANAAKIQQLIQRNKHELHDYVDDLAKWEKEIKSKETQNDVNSGKKVVPPVRNSVKTSASKDKKRISSYDYDKWSKFDVDQACNDVDLADASDAEDNLESLVQQDLQKANMEKEKGNTHFKLGEYDKAINCYSNGLLFDTNNAILYANRAMALLKLEKYGAAESDCTRALEIDPTYIKAFIRKATALEKMGKYELALENHQKILQIEPGHTLATKEAKRLISLTSAKETKRRRHKTPLKRITINEINTASEKATLSKEIKMEKAKAKADNMSRTIAKNEARKENPPFILPRNAFEFEKELAKIKNDQEKFNKFINTIPSKSYNALMKQSIESILPMLIKCYIERLKVNGQNCLDELNEITKLPRFDVAMMFLSSESKKDLTTLFESLKNSKHFDANAIQFNDLRKLYCKM